MRVPPSKRRFFSLLIRDFTSDLSLCWLRPCSPNLRQALGLRPFFDHARSCGCPFNPGAPVLRTARAPFRDGATRASYFRGRVTPFLDPLFGPFLFRDERCAASSFGLQGFFRRAVPSAPTQTPPHPHHPHNHCSRTTSFHAPRKLRHFLISKRDRHAPPPTSSPLLSLFAFFLS